MQLFVRSDAGRTVVVAAESSATVATIEALYAAKHGSSSCGVDQYLAYGGVPLRCERTLEDYGIQNHATLECRRRARGGCFIFSITLWIIIFLCFLLSVCTCGLSLPVALALIPIALVLPLCCL